MAKKHIVILSGDGIGKEITNWGKQVLISIADLYGHSFTFEEQLIGHVAIEKTGNPLPNKTLEACKKADSILLGAVGHPIYDNNPKAKVRPEQGLLKLRAALDLFTNIRPIKPFKNLLHASSLKPEVLEGTDILFCRELTSGIYFGQPRERHSDNTVAVDTMSYSIKEVERISVIAFQAAQKRNKRLCSVDKANVLESSRLWRETVNKVSKNFPDVSLTHLFVDNAAMQLIKKPRQFDVVLTGNMFGDILTDLASQVAGSLGMLPSASLSQKHKMFEPIHGSAPDIAGKNIANPLATILSVALMCDIGFDLKTEATIITKAVSKTLEQGFRTFDIADYTTPKNKILGTKEMGVKVIENCKRID